MKDMVPIDKDSLSVEEVRIKEEENINNALENIMLIPQNLLSTANALARQYRIKHGLNANIPMICKAHDCPFYDVCRVPITQRVVGELCLHEVAAMVSRFESLCTELDISPDDHVDMGLIKDVVDIEIMLMRADKRLALDGDIVKEYFATVDQNGRKHKKEDVNVAVDLKLRLMDKKMKLLEKLNSTRKDKAEEAKKKKDNSVKSSVLMAKARLMREQVKETKKTIEDEKSGIVSDIETVNYEISEECDIVLTSTEDEEEI
jgi:hypothetical protein